MKVLKFGGTSVANPESLFKVITILKADPFEKITVVVSAFGGVTDMLLSMYANALSGGTIPANLLNEIEKRHLDTIKEMIPIAHQNNSIGTLKIQLNTLESLLEAVGLLEESTPKIYAKIIGMGELMAATIIAAIFEAQGLDVIYKDAREIIKTKKVNGRQIVDYPASAAQTLPFFKENKHRIVLVPGFIASNEKDQMTTLGRGGSDFSAAILSYVLDAQALEIWTDVSGMFTANPKLVPQAIPIPKITYQEAMELSHFGAKVIYPPTLQPLIEKEIPVYIKNTFDSNAEGTLIYKNTDNANNGIVKGISHIDNIAMITLEGSGMVGLPGVSKRLFESLYEHKINVIMITQASSEYSICLAVKESDVEIAQETINQQFEYEIASYKIAPAKVERNMANIAVVGEKMKDHQGISGKLFSSVGANNINIRAIAQGASERNISIIIDRKNIKKALNTIHESFFELQIKELNLFIIGVGNVGGKLLAQIQKQQSYLLENLQLRIRVVALSNSRKMVLKDSGIDLTTWEKTLQSSTVAADKEAFFKHAKKQNLRNSVFIDNTADPIIAGEYKRYLENSIGVVTCNKIACSDTLPNYQNLKRISRKYGSPFLFETNVGAGLPIIDTLHNLMASGDKITKIQAILSGSLNFVFGHFKDGVSFHDVVIQAMEQGYTEPDPKIDLSGTDVARKILILARESGYALNMEDIQNESFLPDEVLQTTNKDDFFKALENHKSHFDNLLQTAEKNGTRLKYIAQLDNGEVQVGLQEVAPEHDFYHLEGSDNIVLFYTHRYVEQPLIVKGAGAGAEVTAAGIFGDIIRTGKR